MKLNRRDLAKIKYPLTISSLLILVGTGLVWWSVQQAENAWNRRHAIAQSKEQAEGRLRQVRIEEQELKDRALIYRQLEAAGITGNEKRLDWIEMLKSIQHELGLPSLVYEFGVQRRLDAQAPGTVVWMVSPMRLQLHVLHEEDLLRALAKITKSASALVQVRNCSLTRLSNESVSPATKTFLKADCELQWITAQRISR
ncbi:MAG: hypothetical protein D3M94_21260 [Rhodocyclales bacterium GT-UBC]|nr:MAG: hypothetical protein D3M94_21260 [Rhodocyclales bacterium GT-UBC]